MEENDLTKKYFKIKEVSELLGINASTLRYWEKEFKELSPERNRTGRRLYIAEDIEKLKIIKFLLKTKGLKIEAAKQELRTNKQNVTQKLSIIEDLEKVKKDLEVLLSVLTKRK